MRKAYALVLALIMISVAVAIYLYPQLPEKFESHWNISGQADGYIPKLWGLFLMPIISCGLFCFLLRYRI